MDELDTWNRDGLPSKQETYMYGTSDVYRRLFDFVDFGTASNIQAQIEIAVDNFEPRVNNVRVLVDPQPDLNEFEVTVFFDIIGQQFPTQEFSFLLEATR